MRDLQFYQGTEIVTIRIVGTDVYFRNGDFQGFAPISLLRFDLNGVLKEFPDLKDNPEWRKIAMERFIQHVKSLGSEQLVDEYVVKDLEKHGYVPKLRMIQGFRPERIH